MDNHNNLLAAEQAAIDARHAWLAAQSAQNPSDREYARDMARNHERRAARLRQKARRS